MHLREADKRHRMIGNGDTPAASRFPRASSQHQRETLSNDLNGAYRKYVAASANDKIVAFKHSPAHAIENSKLKLLYTPEQRVRRDATRWTLVQGILAPIQFAVFLVSVILVARYFAYGNGLTIATASIVTKTLLLYAIMITGAIWEREVFGVYLFAPAFFWEDVFSFLVLALHSAYLVALLGGYGTPHQQMGIALAAYATYVVNAAQFILKLRAARRDERLMLSMSGSAA